MTCVRDVHVVIPCVNFDKGIATAEHAIDTCGKWEIDATATIAFDGPPPDVPVYISNSRIAAVYTGGGKGSYFARNAGAQNAHATWLLFIDDDVRISGAAPELLSGYVYGGIVAFDRSASDEYEDWYVSFAFDIPRFANRFGFLPTICLWVETDQYRSLGGFNSTLVSSGDVDFCRRYLVRGGLGLRVSSNLLVTTSLRSRPEILRKQRRLTYGQAVLEFRSSQCQIKARLVIASRIVAGLFTCARQIAIKPRTVVCAAHLWLVKSVVLFRCSVSPRTDVLKLASTANSSEVACRK